MIDTSSAYISFPETLYATVEASLVASGLTCTTNNRCYKTTACTETLTDTLDEFEFTIAGETFVITPATYMQTEKVLGANACVALLDEIPDSETYLVFGEPFLRDYYVTFNFETAQMSFYTEYVESDATSLGAGAITGIVLGVLLLIIIVVVCVCKCKRDKEKKELLDYDANTVQEAERNESLM